MAIPSMLLLRCSTVFEDEAIKIGDEFLYLIGPNLRDRSKYVHKNFGINVPYTSYKKQWSSLVTQLGTEGAVRKILEQFVKVLTVKEQSVLLKAAREPISQQDAELPNLWCLVDYKTRRATKLGLFVLKYGTESATATFDKIQLHHKIVDVSRSLFETGHYTQAIFEAFKSVNNFVKEKAGRGEDGKDLMAKVFSEIAPVIKLNKLVSQSDKDEQEGFKFLFMGAMVGIRNPKAHDSIIQKDPHRTLEYLSFASLLMRRIEEASVPKTKQPKISEGTFTARCRNDGHEKAIDLYIKAKNLKDSRSANGDFINWGTSGCSYRIPWKGCLTGQTIFVMRCDGTLQIWTDFQKNKQGRVAKTKYWEKLRSIPILASQLVKQKYPTISTDTMQSADIDAFISAVRELGLGLATA